MRKLARYKKGQIVNNLQGFVMSVVTIGVILAIGLYVLQELSDNMTTTNSSGATFETNASEATNDIITELAETPVWIGLLIVVVFASRVRA